MSRGPCCHGNTYEWEKAQSLWRQCEWGTASPARHRLWQQMFILAILDHALYRHCFCRRINCRHESDFAPFVSFTRSHPYYTDTSYCIRDLICFTFSDSLCHKRVPAISSRFSSVFPSVGWWLRIGTPYPIFKKKSLHFWRIIRQPGRVLSHQLLLLLRTASTMSRERLVIGEFPVCVRAGLSGTEEQPTADELDSILL